MIKHLDKTVLKDTFMPLMDVLRTYGKNKIILCIDKMDPNIFINFILFNKNINDYTKADLDKVDARCIVTGDIVSSIIGSIGKTNFPIDTCESIIGILRKCKLLNKYSKLDANDGMGNPNNNLMYYMAKVILNDAKIDGIDSSDSDSDSDSERNLLKAYSNVVKQMLDHSGPDTVHSTV